ncbi:hypothetical protein NEHOM01_0719 [Nematocida homosporus]|uniref:uncharacterized protein n=1 Tax=Nematocida homosporus TaxID=1912981 RepID=UPI0022210E5E|nr:uncharacterized protein NEHOM01_0719 [Nematocida homosporus]KAI5185261.1 hypothetical protein NEHOM01_0719 [Nematocida homosporus]
MAKQHVKRRDKRRAFTALVRFGLATFPNTSNPFRASLDQLVSDLPIDQDCKRFIQSVIATTDIDSAQRAKETEWLCNVIFRDKGIRKLKTAAQKHSHRSILLCSRLIGSETQAFLLPLLQMVHYSLISYHGPVPVSLVLDALIRARDLTHNKILSRIRQDLLLATTSQDIWTEVEVRIARLAQTTRTAEPSLNRATLQELARIITAHETAEEMLGYLFKERDNPLFLSLYLTALNELQRQGADVATEIAKIAPLAIKQKQTRAILHSLLNRVPNYPRSLERNQLLATSLYDLFTQTSSYRLVGALASLLEYLPSPSQNQCTTRLLHYLKSQLKKSPDNLLTPELAHLITNLLSANLSQIPNSPQLFALFKTLLTHLFNPTTNTETHVKTASLLTHACLHPALYTSIIDLTASSSSLPEVVLEAFIQSNTLSEALLFTQLAKQCPYTLLNLTRVITQLSSKNQPTLINNLLDWSLTSLQSSPSDYLYSLLSTLAPLSPSTTQHSILAQLLLNHPQPPPTTLLSAINTILQQARPTLTFESESLPPLRTFMRAYPKLISVSPVESLPILYQLGLQLIQIFPQATAQWQESGLALIKRLKGYANNKIPAEAVLLARIANKSTLTFWLAQLWTQTNPLPVKTHRTAVVTAFQHLSIINLPATLTFLLFHYPYLNLDIRTQPKPDRTTSRTTSNNPNNTTQLLPLHHFILNSICKILNHHYLSHKPTRNTLPLLLPLLDHLLATTSPKLRQTACLLAKSLLLTNWGTPTDYSTAVRLLNRIFSLITDSKSASTLISVLPAFATRLSLDFVSTYLIPGLHHPNKQLRRTFRTAFQAVRAGHPFMLSPSQELPYLLFCAN